ncbi:MAG: hypothetical protein R2822_27425 [Spirosomataceae bacterium]
MEALNQDLRKTAIIHFYISYAALLVLLGVALYLNFRKIPELALERNQSTATEINNFLLETTRLDDYVRVLTKTPKPSANQLQTIFGFITQLQARYNKPIFGAVLKSYEAFVGDLGNARNLQDEEWTKSVIKHNQLIEEKKQLEAQLQQLLQQR